MGITANIAVPAGLRTITLNLLTVSGPQGLLNLAAARKGHFLFESGHHGELWLDLELLCLQPRLLQPIAAELARRLSPLNLEIICGPLVEGAFVGLMVASELGLDFVYSERCTQSARRELFSAAYRIPKSLHSCVRQKRVAIVDDVINAGSAVRGTLAALQESGAIVVAIGALLVLGTAASDFAATNDVVLESVATAPNNLWMPDACPLCSSGTPLEDIGGFGNSR